MWQVNHDQFLKRHMSHSYFHSNNTYFYIPGIELGYARHLLDGAPLM